MFSSLLSASAPLSAWAKLPFKYFWARRVEVGERSLVVTANCNEAAYCWSERMVLGVEGKLSGGGEGVLPASKYWWFNWIEGRLSGTTEGLNVIGSIFRNADRMVEVLKVCGRIDWSEEKNSALLNSEHPVRVTASKGSAWLLRGSQHSRMPG